MVTDSRAGAGPAIARPRALDRLAEMPWQVAAALLFAGAAALSAATMVKGFQPNDEGLMLQAAARIAHGQVPYSDFWWYYPPGQPYLLALLWKVFGPSMLTWRIVRVLSDAAVAVLVFALARRRAPVWLSLVAWLGAACAMAFPSGPHPFPIALAFALGTLLAFERRPAPAGILAGLCAVWRLEFAAYLVIGIAIAYALQRERREAIRFGAATAITTLVLYAPVVIAAGVGTSLRLLVKYPLFDFSKYQSLPLSTDYNGPLNTSSIGGFLSDSAENLVHFYLPLALLITTAGALIALVVRNRRDLAPMAAPLVFTIGMGSYLLVRPDEFHTAPLAVMLCVLAAWVLAVRPGRVLAVAWAAAAVGLAWVVVEGVDRRVRTIEEHDVALHVPIADGVQGKANRVRPLEKAVSYVDGHVPRGRPIYVATARSDLVTSGAPLFYVAAGRANPSRYDIAAPGVVTTAKVQREIAGSLERTRTPMVVRYTAPITAAREPNRAGTSSGVVLLDRYIAANYRQVAKFGFYVLLERRSG
ncbi:MAG: glycosyltransferase 87 family protein [Thermoleophilaceae bacterium]